MYYTKIYKSIALCLQPILVLFVVYAVNFIDIFGIYELLAAPES